MLIGCNLSRQCLKPGNDSAERLVIDLVMAGRPPGWRCSAPLAWRRCCEKADHYFLINDGPRTLALIDSFDAKYTGAVNVLTGESLPLGGSTGLDVPAASGCWLRFDKP